MTAGYKIARSFAFNLDLKFRTFFAKESVFIQMSESRTRSYETLLS